MTDTELTDAEAEEFRARCRAFLEEHASRPDTSIDDGRAFLAAAVEAGLAGITYPTEYGGAGLTTAHDKIWREEKGRFPTQDGEFVISHGMCLPMLNEWGTPEQKKEFLADNIAGRTMWCQMFSEPGAGSDVASLQTRAERDGDEWIINGQKVWTTLAHVSDYGLIVARTDPSLPKHAGLSMFILDMRSPGVEIRPIHQIDGGRHFNEVFFTDVRVPADWILGDLNNGWRMATSMLMYERVAIGSMSAGGSGHQMYDQLVDIARRRGVLGEPVVRDDLARLYTLETCKSLVSLRTRSELQAGKTPGPGGSLGKLMGSNISWFYRSIAQRIAGPESIAWSGTESGTGQVQRQVVSSFASGIAGGTDEIQRNIIGDRVLGLPRDIAVDRDVPFSEFRVGTQR